MWKRKRQVFRASASTKKGPLPASASTSLFIPSMNSDALILAVKSNKAFHNSIPKKLVKKLIRLKMGESAHCVSGLQEVVVMRSMIWTEGSQRRLLLRKSHQGCKLATLLLSGNDTAMGLDTFFWNL